MMLDSKHLRPLESGQRSTCPECDAEIVACCGTIKTWYWRHLILGNCKYGEGETEWHMEWKQFFLDHGCDIEVKIGNHRADAVLPDGTVVEFQHSSISPEEIAEREAEYKKLIWVFDLSRFKTVPSFKKDGKFSWNNIKRSMKEAKKAVVVEVNGKLYSIIYWNGTRHPGKYKEKSAFDILVGNTYPVGKYRHGVTKKDVEYYIDDNGELKYTGYQNWTPRMAPMPRVSNGGEKQYQRLIKLLNFTEEEKQALHARMVN